MSPKYAGDRGSAPEPAQLILSIKVFQSAQNLPPLSPKCAGRLGLCPRLRSINSTHRSVPNWSKLANTDITRWDGTTKPTQNVGKKRSAHYCSRLKTKLARDDLNEYKRNQCSAAQLYLFALIACRLTHTSIVKVVVSSLFEIVYNCHISKKLFSVT